MRKELKKAIIEFMLENINTFGLVNCTVEHFRQYIYDDNGGHCIGGASVHDFICIAEKLLKMELE